MRVSHARGAMTARADQAGGAERKRRKADRRSVAAIGWAACVVLSGSLIYTFVKALVHGPEKADPWFMAAQTLASALFLVYSLRLKNVVFVTANAVAIASALGTLLLKVLKG